MRAFPDPLPPVRRHFGQRFQHHVQALHQTIDQTTHFAHARRIADGLIEFGQRFLQIVEQLVTVAQHDGLLQHFAAVIAVGQLGQEHIALADHIALCRPQDVGGECCCTHLRAAHRDKWAGWPASVAAPFPPAAAPFRLHQRFIVDVVGPPQRLFHRRWRQLFQPLQHRCAQGPHGQIGRDLQQQIDGSQLARGPSPSCCMPCSTSRCPLSQSAVSSSIITVTPLALSVT
jgi:hypothetical protein